LPNRRTASEEGLDGVTGIARPARSELPASALTLERALDEDVKRGELEGLREELVGAFLDGSHREIDAAVARQNEHRRIRIYVAQFGKQIEGIAITEQVIDNCNVRLEGLKEVLRLRARVGLGYLKTLGAQIGANALAKDVFVVDYQDSVAGHG
jgi:hypothetical protein